MKDLTLLCESESEQSSKAKWENEIEYGKFQKYQQILNEIFGTRPKGIIYEHQITTEPRIIKNSIKNSLKEKLEVNLKLQISLKEHFWQLFKLAPISFIIQK